MLGLGEVHEVHVVPNHHYSAVAQRCGKVIALPIGRCQLPEVGSGPATIVGIQQKDVFVRHVWSLDTLLHGRKFFGRRVHATQ